MPNLFAAIKRRVQKRTVKQAIVDDWWQEVSPNMGLQALSEFLQLVDRTITSSCWMVLKQTGLGLADKWMLLGELGLQGVLCWESGDPWSSANLAVEGAGYLQVFHMH